MELNLTPNPLHRQVQTLRIDKVATLIGENGSGKSSILQSVFEQRLAGRDHEQLKVVCFSSGQNENYSEKFSTYLKRERQSGRGLSLDCFYFDKSWSKLLIFLATAIKRNGKVRSFLVDHGYVTESQLDKDDVSTTFKCAFKVDKNYIARVQSALKQEERGEANTLRATPYFRSLDSFITNLISRGYDFEEPLRKRTINITANGLIQVSFDYPRQVQAGDDEAEAGEPDAQAMATSWDPEVAFFTQAADNNYFIDKSRCKLVFKNNIELDQLSDGEYQLLFLYALIDLFDSDNTLFLFDEADSHLHYKNVEKLWALLHSIKGHAITTTHLLDSISAKENRIEHLKVVEHGRINEDNKIKQLISRLSVLSRAKSVEFEVCGKLPNIALLDDYNDWIIFTKLAARKGLDISRLAPVHAIGKPSSRKDDNEQIGRAKIDWTQSLSKTEAEFATQNVFLLCDRDNSNPQWHENGVLLLGAPKDEVNRIRWPRNGVHTYLLAWRRREIENYLLSYSALTHFGVIDAINNDLLAQGFHLRDGNPGDNDGIMMLDVKHIVNPLIQTQGVGKDLNKIEFYINQMKPEEISEDITNMFNFIIGKL
ncbi:ATP-binding protein [Aeromonas caviae]|uniref:ATP-binding protein n=1 Tax=Aeromonas caviae TaxID=648 RepID=A0A3S7PAK9_AERCA|nr:AAA family ATPase [Aeromonas caviae]AXB05036.1 ATP-binding protein [Aeromonas caviae]AXB10111.1 ATP-binding protein [Aeromonas caviae]